MDIGVDTPQEPESAIPKVAVRPRFDAIELGSTLRETRVALGHDLGEVANDLRIRNVYLQAIEEGRLGDLPGHAYATGFLRAYGDYLGLDGGDIVARYKASGGAAAGQTDLHLPSPVEEGRLPTASVLVLAALLAVCAYGGWYYMASTNEDPAEQVAALPDKIAALVGNDVMPAPSTAEGSATAPAVIGSDPTASPAPAPADDAASTATPAGGEAPEPVADRGTAASGAEDGSADADADAAPTGETTVAAAPAEPVPTTAPVPAAPETASVPATAAMPAAPTPATPRTASVPTPVPPPARLPASSREAVAPAPRAAAPEATAMVEPPPADTEADTPAPADVPTASAAASRIVLRANTDSWVEVRADGADPLYSGLLRQGDSYNVPEQPGLTMVTGNAGGIEILVDGKAIPRLGPPGAVRRDVVLDAEALLQTARQ